MSPLPMMDIVATAGDAYLGSEPGRPTGENADPE